MNNIVGNEDIYKTFVGAVLSMDEDTLPIILEHREPNKVTTTDIFEFINRFKQDTGMDTSIHFHSDDTSDQIHMTIVVDVPQEKEYGHLRLLQ